MIPIPMSGKTLSQACFPAQPFCIYFAISEISDTFALPTRRNILRVPLSALIRQPLRPDHPGHAKPSSPPHRQRKAHTSPDGGIGRRAGLKHQWSNPCRFDPGSGYLTKCKCLIFKHLHFSFSFLHHICTTVAPPNGLFWGKIYVFLKIFLLGHWLRPILMRN